MVPKHRHTAVERNELKRRLRELLRRVVLPGLDGAGRALDVIVRARREAYGIAFSGLREELESWLRQRCSRAS